MSVGFIGAGQLAFALARGFTAAGGRGAIRLRPGRGLHVGQMGTGRVVPVTVG